jgi:acyl-CoA synthetase (AMP-forming)/AMP-acid ligase II
VAIAGAATGIVLTLSTRDSLIRFGAKSLLPAVVVFSIVKESGPIITALVVSGRTAAGICAEPSFAMVAGLLAVLKAGGAYLPLDPAHPPERLAALLADSGAQAVLAVERAGERLPSTVRRAKKKIPRCFPCLRSKAHITKPSISK